MMFHGTSEEGIGRGVQTVAECRHRGSKVSGQRDSALGIGVMNSVVDVADPAQKTRQSVQAVNRRVDCGREALVLPLVQRHWAAAVLSSN
jgi:hypothetical protein